MRRANVVSGIVLALFGLVMLFAVIPWQIDPGPEGMVSPRLVPSMMMVLIVALSAILIASNMRAPQDGLPEPGLPLTWGELVALAKIGAVFTVAILLFVFVSPLAAGAALIVGSLVALGERRPLVLVLMPAVLLLALWALFYKVLGTAIL